MATKIQLRRKINATGAPAAVSGAGEVAIAFPDAAPGVTTPELYASDGAAWIRVNPITVVSTVGSVTLPGGTPGSSAGIGAAWTAFAAKPTDPIVIASFAGSTYVRTGAGGADGDWTSLSSAIQFANVADIHGGTNADKALNSVGLRGETLNAPSTGPGTPAAADADKLVRLDAGGQLDVGFIPLPPFATAAEIKAGTATGKSVNPVGLIDPEVSVAAPTGAGGLASNTDAGKLLRLDPNGQVLSAFLPAIPSDIKGAADPTVAPVPPADGYKSGDILFANKAGAIDAGWTGATGNSNVGDAFIFDGTNWHVLPNNTDLNAYLKLIGGTMVADATITFDVGSPTKTILDGNGGTVDNVVLDCGAY